jgi:hypothetical protein
MRNGSSHEHKFPQWTHLQTTKFDAPTGRTKNKLVKIGQMAQKLKLGDKQAGNMMIPKAYSFPFTKHLRFKITFSFCIHNRINDFDSASSERSLYKICPVQVDVFTGS